MGTMQFGWPVGEVESHRIMTAALYLAQSAQNEFAQFVRAHWWKAVAVVLLLTIVAAVVTVNVMAR